MGFKYEFKKMAFAVGAVAILGAIDSSSKQEVVVNNISKTESFDDTKGVEENNITLVSAKDAKIQVSELSNKYPKILVKDIECLVAKYNKPYFENDNEYLSFLDSINMSDSTVETYSSYIGNMIVNSFLTARGNDDWSMDFPYYNDIPKISEIVIPEELLYTSTIIDKNIYELMCSLDGFYNKTTKKTFEPVTLNSNYNETDFQVSSIEIEERTKDLTKKYTKISPEVINSMVLGMNKVNSVEEDYLGYSGTMLSLSFLTPREDGEDVIPYYNEIPKMSEIIISNKLSELVYLGDENMDQLINWLRALYPNDYENSNDKDNNKKYSLLIKNYIM